MVYNIEDVFGIGVSNTHVNQSVADVTLPFSRSKEHIGEIYYLLNLGSRIALTPDVQYLVSPGGASSCNHMLIGILRLMMKYK